jgi:Fe2+ or Zn2+ uptake regulation protein
MLEKRKYHFNVGEVKSKILEIILETRGPIKEPDIREYLSEKLGVIDQSTINKHLKYLKDNGYVEKVSPLERSRFNLWDIGKFEQLKKIRSDFKSIKLNEHEKAIMMVLQKNGYKINDLQGFFIYIQLLLSDSFFIACIETSMETLISRIRNIYSYKNSLRERIIKERLEESYVSYINLYPIIISKEDYFAYISEMAGKCNEMSLSEVCMKTWEEMMLGFPTKTSDETQEGTIEDNLKIYREIEHLIELIRLHCTDYNESFFSLLFEGFFYQDSLLGVASKEEINFALETKANYEEYLKSYCSIEDYNTSFKKVALSDLKQASLVMYDKKQPSLFDKKIYNNQDDIYKALEKYFEREIKELSKSPS